MEIALNFQFMLDKNNINIKKLTKICDSLLVLRLADFGINYL